ncbi:hypothetical protein F4815DRAFT_347430 [Daldinia loculata]|nr:hypothetical protein F4815DRAFT_347430 [Daldinia loculata]
MPSNTPFLIYIGNIDRLGVYLNNVKNVLIHNGKKYPVIRKWKHPWFLLDNRKTTVAYCYLTKAKLQQIHKRFSHPAAAKLIQILKRTKYNNLNTKIINKIGKYYHQY